MRPSSTVTCTRPSPVIASHGGFDERWGTSNSGDTLEESIRTSRSTTSAPRKVVFEEELQEDLEDDKTVVGKGVKIDTSVWGMEGQEEEEEEEGEEGEGENSGREFRGSNLSNSSTSSRGDEGGEKGRTVEVVVIGGDGETSGDVKDVTSEGVSPSASASASHPTYTLQNVSVVGQSDKGCDVTVTSDCETPEVVYSGGAQTAPEAEIKLEELAPKGEPDKDKGREDAESGYSARKSGASGGIQGQGRGLMVVVFLSLCTYLWM